MNILVIGKFNKFDFGKHISENFQKLGHNTFEFESGINFHSKISLFKRWNSLKYSVYNNYLSSLNYFREREKKRLKKIITKKIDMILVTHDYLRKDDIDFIRTYTSAPIVLWFPDPINNIKKGYMFLAGYDFLIFVDKYISNRLKEEFKLNTFFLPQAFYPKYHHKIKLSNADKQKYGCEITNAGNMTPNRAALFSLLNEFDIKMWGTPPAQWIKNEYISRIHQEKEVYGEEKIKAFSCAKIVLNNLSHAVINGINKRAFEIPACGGFQIIRHCNVITELFEENKEIVTYSSFEELTDKIKYYLKNDKEREKIAEAGFNRAYKDHHYEIRLQQILNIVFKS